MVQVWVLFVFLNGQAFTPYPRTEYKSYDRCEQAAKVYIAGTSFERVNFSCRRENGHHHEQHQQQKWEQCPNNVCSFDPRKGGGGS